MAKLRDELKQTAAFAPAQEAYLNVMRTADWLTRGVVEVLKAHDLSPTQYNVLRILRGAEPAGRSCGEIAERLVTREPDVTRLLDRMAKRELISRERSEKDRRVVVTRVTREGLRLLAELDGQVAAVHERQFGHLEANEMATLVRLLERVRAG